MSIKSFSYHTKQSVHVINDNKLNDFQLKFAPLPDGSVEVSLAPGMTDRLLWLFEGSDGMKAILRHGGRWRICFSPVDNFLQGSNSVVLLPTLVMTFDVLGVADSCNSYNCLRKRRFYCWVPHMKWAMNMQVGWDCRIFFEKVYWKSSDIEKHQLHWGNACPITVIGNKLGYTYDKMDRQKLFTKVDGSGLITDTSLVTKAQNITDGVNIGFEDILGDKVEFSLGNPLRDFSEGWSYRMCYCPDYPGGASCTLNKHFLQAVGEVG
jgi:hypothetical protein